ncbi:hypothetical protein Tco_1158551, partial [Tanacetum coccineum]
MKRLFKIGRSAQVVSSKDESLGDQEDASKQRRKIAYIDADTKVTLVDETQGRNDEEMFNTGILDGEEVFAEQDVVEKEVSIAEVAIDSATTTTVDELTLAARGVVVQEPSEFTTTTSPSQPSQLPQAKDKGKAKMVEPEKPLMKKDQIMFDKDFAQKLQAQLDAELEEEKKLARQREEDANIAEWDNVQAMIDVDYELAARLQAKEQGEFTIKKSQDCLAREELESENLKKQKLDENVEAEVDDDQEEAEMKKHMEIVPDDEVAIDAIPLATKPPIIVDWKIIKEGKMGYFQIIRADGSSKRYSSMIQMLQNI